MFLGREIKMIGSITYGKIFFNFIPAKKKLCFRPKRSILLSIIMFRMTELRHKSLYGCRKKRFQYRNVFLTTTICLRRENIFHISSNRHKNRCGRLFGFKICKSWKINMPIKNLASLTIGMMERWARSEALALYWNIGSLFDYGDPMATAYCHHNESQSRSESFSSRRH
jgi:hypothetical protein